MRNASEHPTGHSGQLKISNFTLRADGTITDPFWSREKDGKTEYGPLAIVGDMHVGVQNLLILAEDVLIMWAKTHLSMPHAMAVTVVPESKRAQLCPIKYRIGPSGALLDEIAKLEAAKSHR
jgi:hypothetical protein